MNKNTSVSLESSGRHPDTNLPFEFGLTSITNGDMYIEICNWFNRYSEVTLRLYSSFGSNEKSMHNTLNAFQEMEKLLDGRKYKIKKANLEKTVFIENAEGRITLDHDTEMNEVKLSIFQFREDGKKCNNNAYVIFSLESAEKSTDELVLKVRREVFDCLAHIQQEMKKDLAERNKS